MKVKTQVKAGQQGGSNNVGIAGVGAISIGQGNNNGNVGILLVL
jgi:hypothetical protein